MKKIIVIGQEPILISDEQATKVLTAIGRGDKMIVINGQAVATSSISGVRDYEEEIRNDYVFWNSYVAPKRQLQSGKSKNTGTKGYEKFLKAREELKKKLRTGVK